MHGNPFLLFLYGYGVDRCFILCGYIFEVGQFLFQGFEELEPALARRRVGFVFRFAPRHRIEAFAEIVNRAGYASPVRTPRGQDILAACGQLKSATERARKGRAVVA